MSKGLRYFAELFSEPPYASKFNKRDAADKSLMELSIISEWCCSMTSAFDRQVSNIKVGGDPPDFLCTVDQKESSVELTELVDGLLKSEVVQRRRGGEKVSPSSPDIFSRAQWDSTRLRKEIQSILTKKSRSQLDLKFDNILLVHTDEPWLNKKLVEELLQSPDLELSSGFDEVHLIMSYCPHTGYWPLYRII